MKEDNSKNLRCLTLALTNTVLHRARRRVVDTLGDVVLNHTKLS